MKISEIITMLEEYKKKHGDVVLHSEKDDGRSSWVSPAKVLVEERGYWPDYKKLMHSIRVDAGY